jgi:hypothetical protein
MIALLSILVRTRDTTRASDWDWWGTIRICMAVCRNGRLRYFCGIHCCLFDYSFAN